MAKNNECIEERKDSFRVHIPYYDQLGSRRFYSKSFSVKKYGSRAKALEMAKKHRDEIKVKIAGDQIVKTEKYTFKAVYLLSMDLYTITKETRRKLDLIFNKYAFSVIDPETDFSKIKYAAIQKQLNSMVSEASNDTIKRVFSIWKRLYKNAIALNVVYRDETINVTVPRSEKVIKKREQTTSYTEVLKVLAMIDEKTEDQRDKMLYKNALLIMLYTGMRPSEVFALEVSAIDQFNRTINIYQRTGSTSKEKYTIVKVKTDSSARLIQYPPELISVFSELIDNAKNGLLFIRSNGKLLNGDQFSDRINKISGGSFRAYSLRHQLTTDLITQGTDLRTIMELMGHSESTMTLYYARSNEEKKRAAIENRIINDVPQA